MAPLVIVMLAWVGLYPLAALALFIGIHRLPRSRSVSDAQAPTVTVVVTARNEERDLPRCIESLLALDYPREKLQIVLVDDLSSDGTGTIIDAAARLHSHVLALHSATLPDNGLEAKARGVAHGFAHASGEWVLITDADAAVPPGWARHLLGDAGPDVTVVGGTLVVEPRRWWGVAERVVNLFLQSINHGVAGWGAPVAAVGPNMGIRRAAYERAGGLAAAPRQVAEDLTLYALATREGGATRNYLGAETTARLIPVPTPRHLISQLRRFTGGAVQQDWRFAVGLGLALSWGSIMAAFVFLGWRIALVPWLMIVVIKLVSDRVLLGAQSRGAGETPSWREALLLQPLQLVFVPLCAITLVRGRRMTWRGEGYDVRFR